MKTNRPKKDPYMPFTVPGHHWVPRDGGWIEPEAIVIRTVLNHALVDNSNVHSERSFEKPSLPEAQIKAWKEPHNCPELEACRQEFYAHKATGNLYAHAKESNSSLLDLYIKANSIVGYLNHLAEKGNQKAVERLAEIAIEATSCLSVLAKSNPSLLRPMAGNCIAWPLIKSIHPLLSDDSEDLLNTKLKLGSALGLDIRSNSHWKIDDPVGKIALALVLFISRARTQPNKDYIDYGIYGKHASKLPPFSTGSALDWWGMAKECFLFSYPNPEKVEAFNQLVLSPQKRKSPGRIKAAILEMIRRRFLGMAPNPDKTHSKPRI